MEHTLTASGPGQFSWEGQRWGGQGVFTKILDDGLASADRNNDGIISGDEIFDFVHERVAQETSNKQQPWRAGASLAQVGIFSGGQVAHTATSKPSEQSSNTAAEKTPSATVNRDTQTAQVPTNKTAQAPNTSAAQASNPSTTQVPSDSRTQASNRNTAQASDSSKAGTSSLVGVSKPAPATNPRLTTTSTTITTTRNATARRRPSC